MKLDACCSNLIRGLGGVESRAYRNLMISQLVLYTSSACTSMLYNYQGSLSDVASHGECLFGEESALMQVSGTYRDIDILLPQSCGFLGLTVDLLPILQAASNPYVDLDDLPLSFSLRENNHKLVPILSFRVDGVPMYFVSVL